MLAIASPSSFVLRAAFVGVSAVVHVAAFAAFGHTTRGARAFDPVEISLETAMLEPADRAETPDAPPTSEPRTEEPPPPHTHPYPVPASHDERPHDPTLVHLPIPSAVDAPAVAAAPAVETVSTTAPARFLIVVGNAAASPGGVVSAQGTSVTGAGVGTDASEPASESEVSEPARPIRMIKPAFPSEARAQGIEADVPVDIVVGERGTVVEARVARHVGYGFDEAALTAMRAWEYRPALRSGRPTPVRKRVFIQFKLDH